jgi:cell division septum initiation protein DivIVA
MGLRIISSHRRHSKKKRRIARISLTEHGIYLTSNTCRTINTALSKQLEQSNIETQNLRSQVSAMLAQAEKTRITSELASQKQSESNKILIDSLTKQNNDLKDSKAKIATESIPKSQEELDAANAAIDLLRRSKIYLERKVEALQDVIDKGMHFHSLRRI